MARKSLSIPLFVAALAIAAWSSAHAKPLVSVLEPDDDARTFSNASASRSATGKHGSFDISRSDDRDRTFSESLHETSGSNGLHNGWTKEPKFPQKHGHDAAPVTAVPEPSTYALLLVGIAGMALVKRLRRARSA